MEESFNIRNSIIPEDEQSQICNLLPIGKLFPANEILSKCYASDTKAKIIIKRSEQQQTQTKRKSVIKMFQEKDTLGYNYEKYINEHMVFTCFDNMKFLKHQTQKNRKQIKYLAGFFLDDLIIEKAQAENSNIFSQVTRSKLTLKEGTLKFEANKCSSNLLYAFHKKGNEYDLIVHNDTNSKGSTQWFNFNVSFERKATYKFNIVNLTKKQSLFNKGMNVVFCSSKSKSDGNLSNYSNWERLQSDIKYAPNHIQMEERNQDCFYKTLSFSYKSSEKEKVTFCYGYPYTIEDSQEFWRNTCRYIYKKTKPKYNLQVMKIGQTVTGLNIESYVIKETQFETKTNLKSIVFMGRQHSGETQGSFIIEGIVDFITNNIANSLRKSFIYHFVPMINMQGVLYGNYRTNIKGYDLNRNWRYSQKNLHPEPFYIKKYLKKINEENPISLIIDLHGHSKSFNSFFYGFPRNSKENPKILPYYLSKKMKQISYNQCNFNVSEDKKNTARVVLSEMFPKTLVYTLQSSFYGWKSKDKVIDYCPQSLRKLGKDLIVNILDYYSQTQIGIKSIEYKRQLQKQIQKLQKTTLEVIKDSIESDSQAEDQLLYENSKDEDKVNSNREKLISERLITNLSPNLKKDKKYHRNYVNRKLLKKQNNGKENEKENLKTMISEKMIRLLRTKSKKQSGIPLLSVNVMRPVSREYVYKRISSTKRNTNCNNIMSNLRLSPNNKLNGVSFLNEKELTFEEIRRRRMMKEDNINSEILKQCIIPLQKKKAK